jgi:hypothetical protein
MAKPKAEAPVQLTVPQIRACISGIAYLSAGELGEDGGYSDQTEYNTAQRAFERLHQALAAVGASVHRPGERELT